VKYLSHVPHSAIVKSSTENPLSQGRKVRLVEQVIASSGGAAREVIRT
jgi:hypothetical protein